MGSRPDLHAVAQLVEEHEKHRVEHHHLDIEFYRRNQAIAEFSKVDELGGSFRAEPSR